MENGHLLDQEVPIPQPRLIAHVVSDHARDTPHKIWGSIPNSQTDASQGYEDITFARLNYAISRGANWLVDNIKPQKSRDFEALAYIGAPDSRYIVFAIAAIKAGFQMLFLSPRNSDEAQEAVIRQANCQKFLCSSTMRSRIEELLEGRPGLAEMTVYVVPEQDDLLKDEFVAEFPYNKTLEEARTEPLVTLHTSSTTGIPKTIPLNQGYGLHEDVVQHVPKYNGLDIITRKPFYGHCRMFVSMPLFHAGGVLLVLLKSLYHDIVSVFQPSEVPLDSQVFDAILRHANCNGCVIPPYLLEDMLAEPSYFDTLANLKFVQFGSGPLSKSAGDSLLTRQKDCPHYIGSSECGLYILLELDDPVSDWQYFRFHPWSGIDMRPLDADGDTSELFIVRSGAPKIPGMQPVFELFPELDEWPTRDIYVRHPTKPDHWRCIGRNDDVLVLSNGEKLNPVETEGRIANAHPLVSGALVIGQGQFAPGLLMEVRDADMTDLSKRAELIEELWPSIKAANKEAPGHGQLTKALILFTSPGKPFLRTPKLSIRRKPTVDLYAKEIEEMYTHYMNNAEDNGDDNAKAVDFTTISGVQNFILDTLRSVTGWESQLGLDDDLFIRGMDSLQVVQITRVLQRALRGHFKENKVPPQLVYRNPSINLLSEAIFKMAHKTQEDLQVSREELIEDMIDRYSNFDPNELAENGSLNGSTQQQDSKMNVILTGSTGSLGSHILLSLVANKRVRHVYCLNRSVDARERQLKLLENQGIDKSTLANFESRVQFVHTTSLADSNLGIADSEMYESLRRDNITHIVHNAWPVNFNISLSSFESQIAGVRALLDFSLSIPQHPKIMFVSSFASVTALSTKKRVSETIVFDPSAPAHMGYGESKYVAEHILDKATELSNGLVPTTILRIGQIAGPVKSSTAVWPIREWFPSLIISSRSVGALPTSLGHMSSIDWVPVDLLAECINDLLNDPKSSSRRKRAQSDVFHILNPNAISWSELLPTIGARIGVENIVSLSEWIELVRNGPEETSTERPNPAKKILQFYEALEGQSESEVSDSRRSSRNDGKRRKLNEAQRFALVNMAKQSQTFKKLGPVTNAWMEKWIDGWL